MNDMTLLYICVGGAVSMVAFFVSRVAVGGKDGKLRQLSNATQSQLDKQQAKSGSATSGAVVPFLQKIGAAAAEPFMPKTREKQSSMRRDLGYAGIYSASATKLVQGAKMIFLVTGLLIGYVAGIFLDNIMLYLALGGLAGYFCPKFWLKSRINKNQRLLTLGLPDALDLMVVCVEAGLTIDSAMQRVGEELVLAHPAVSRELGIAHMETRVGLSRQEALKNLGSRTGNASFQSLAAMLVQADRFGTSIANALRIHADSMRVNRQQQAEEMAAKASVKMSFPLVLFIFPSTFIVLAGPTVIGLMEEAHCLTINTGLIRRFAKVRRIMNIKASTLRTILLLSLGTVGLTACGTDGSYNQDFFPPTDGNRRIDQIFDAQADKGAAEDATLQARHFDGKKLNSLGCEKLDRMIPDDPDADITVYVNLTDSDIASARKTDVIAYLGEWGIPSSHVKIETGENPNNSVSSAEQIANLPKADTGEAAGGSSGGESGGAMGTPTMMK